MLWLFLNTKADKAETTYGQILVRCTRRKHYEWVDTLQDDHANVRNEERSGGPFVFTEDLMKDLNV